MHAQSKYVINSNLNQKDAYQRVPQVLYVSVGVYCFLIM